MLSSINKLVINLPERTDRLIKFYERADTIGLTNVKIVNGIRKHTPFHGIAEAHMECIKIAKANNWDKVLIMEDDVMFSQGFTEYTTKVFNDLPTNWDILLGGIYHARTSVSVNSNWNKVSEFCALHFYMVNSRAYDKLLTYDYTQHYDRWIGRLGINCYVPKKLFAIQEDGFSDNVGKVTDYNNTYLKKFDILK
jgi:hypothetical protein